MEDPSREHGETQGRGAGKPPCSAVMWPTLPKWELLIYASIVVVVYSYATYKFYQESEGIVAMIKDINIVEDLFFFYFDVYVV